jgi:hypothetical protein
MFRSARCFGSDDRGWAAAGGGHATRLRAETPFTLDIPGLSVCAEVST